MDGRTAKIWLLITTSTSPAITLMHKVASLTTQWVLTMDRDVGYAQRHCALLGIPHDISIPRLVAVIS